MNPINEKRLDRNFDGLTVPQKRALAIVFVSTQTHDWNDWEEMTGLTEKQLETLYNKLAWVMETL